jgi:nucleotide-binding universal stress UspA family protein
VTILVAYDGSPEAKRALRHAADLVGRGGSVAVLNVIPVQAVSARLETVSAEQRAEQRHLLEEARSVLARRRVGMTPLTAVGDPATEIRAAAEKTRAGIVVVGRKNGRARLIRGSVSTRLVRRAPCDVLIVH